jgi:hypothetical protein
MAPQRRPRAIIADRGNYESKHAVHPQGDAMNTQEGLIRISRVFVFGSWLWLAVMAVATSAILFDRDWGDAFACAFAGLVGCLIARAVGWVIAGFATPRPGSGSGSGQTQ